MKRTMIAVATVSAIALTTTLAMADMKPMTASAQDGLFVTDANQGNMTEIKTSEYVADETKNQDIKALAEKMISDHKMVTEKLSKAASDADVYMMDGLDPSHKAVVEAFKKTPAIELDKSFLTLMDKEHRDAIFAFKAEAFNGMNPGLMQVASSALPDLQQHQAMITEMEMKMGLAAGTMPSMADQEKKPLHTKG